MEIDARKLEGKFKEEFNSHPGRWVSRILLEPGYSLRNVFSLPKETPNLPSLKKAAIGYEIIKLGGYGLIAYSIVESFLK